jgi:hypothetical protein
MGAAHVERDDIIAAPGYGAVSAYDDGLLLCLYLCGLLGVGNIISSLVPVLFECYVGRSVQVFFHLIS